MTYTDIFTIKTELVVFLRNSDIIPVGTRGVTTTTQEFNGDNVETQFQLTNTNVKNVRSVTVGGVAVAYGSGYTVDYITAQINFTTAPVAGTNNVDIEYDYGTTDKIFPDFPQDSLNLMDFPRVAVDVISATTTELELGAGSNFTDYNITVVAYDIDQDNVEDMVATIRSSLMSNKKSFYYFPFVKPTGMGPIMRSPFGKNKVFQRNQDFQIKYVYED